MKQFEIVRSIIERNIIEGRYPIASPMPRLEELAEEQSCSVATVRRALRDLIDAGVVESAKKRGTVVLRKPAAGRAVIFLSADAHTNVILQEPICTVLTQAHFDVDIMAGGVGETALRNWSRRLLSEEREPDALVILGASVIDRDYPGALTVLNEFFPRQIMVGLDTFNCKAGKHLSWIVPDWRREARCLADHLLALGHKRAAIWGGQSTAETGWYRQVAEQFKELWEFADGTCRLNFGGNAKAQLLQWIHEEGVTAYVDLNDNIALETLSVLQSAGIRVPEDFSIIGRHNTPWAESAHPPLTSLSLNPAGIAEAVLKAIRQISSGDTKGRVYSVDPAIVVRQSTGPAPLAAS